MASGPPLFVADASAASTLPSIAPNRPGELRVLTLFRFGAAFWVLLFHLRLALDVRVISPFDHLLSNGAYAMSFFFVLSGTVLAFSYYDLGTSQTDLRAFYLARIARIYPAYLLIQLLGALWLPVPWSDWPRWVYINAMGLLGLQAWLPHSFMGVNHGTWSISCEFFFYLLFPGLLPLVRNLAAPVVRRRLILALLLFIGFLSIGDFAFRPEGTFPNSYISPPFRLPEFILGMVIGVALRSSNARPMVSAGTVGLAALVLLATSCNTAYRTGLWTRANLLVVPAISWLIYCASTLELARRDSARPLSVPHPVHYLGQASYSIFLAHLPLLAAIPRLRQPDSLLAPYLRGAPFASLLVGVLLALILGVLLHELVEKPLRRLILSRFSCQTNTDTPPSARLTTQSDPHG